MEKIKSTFVRKRGNNYNVMIEYFNDDNKLKQKSVGKYSTKKEAEKHLIDLKSSINNNKYIISKDITLVDRCRKYIEDNKADWSPHTTLGREKIIKYHLEPFFQDTKLQELTVYQVQGFVNHIFSNFAAESSKVRYSFLKTVLNDCYRLREITENVCDFVKIPRQQQKAIADVYNREELIAIFERIKGQFFELPILLISLLGLRKSECYGLTWDCVDFQNNTIKIDKISIYMNKELSFKDPKTPGSKRILSAPAELMAKLKQEKIRQNHLRLSGIIENEFNLVCLNRQLKPYREDDLNRYFRKFCEENNFKHLRIHDLRHTNATLLLLSGTDIKTISGRLGHADTKITMNRYSHVLEEMDRKASDNLSKLLFNTK